MKNILCLLFIVFLIPSCKSKIPTANLEIRDDTGKVVFFSKDAQYLDSPDGTGYSVMVKEKLELKSVTEKYLKQSLTLDLKGVAGHRAVVMTVIDSGSLQISKGGMRPTSGGTEFVKPGSAEALLPN